MTVGYVTIGRDMNDLYVKSEG